MKRGILTPDAITFGTEGPMNRNTGFFIIALTAFCGIAAAFGGWATVTVENLPDHLTAGQPYNLTFSIRQHGDNLLTDLSPYVEMRNGKSDVAARAVATNRPGYYTATLNVPSTGAWDATIQTSFGKSRLKLMPLEAVAAGARPARVLSLNERGHRLFVAKGCVGCHVHANVEGSGYYQVGPDLSEKRFAADYLKQFLADPSIKPPTKPNAKMPKLNLQPAEINALVAFINAERAKVASAMHN